MMVETKEMLAGVLAMVVVAALMLLLVAWLSSEVCEKQWARSGLKSHWQVFGGCIVQRKDGTWVPASAMRDLSL
jgi:hypothetical protein